MVVFLLPSRAAMGETELAATGPEQSPVATEPDPISITETEAAIDPKGGQSPLSIGGRVFIQGAYEKVRGDTPAGATIIPPSGPGAASHENIDLKVPSARLSIKYTFNKHLSTILEVDLAGKPDMKDGFIQAKSKHLTGRVGQFKMPVSAIEMESPWTLPMATRGLLHDLLTDRMQIAGRRPGAIATVKAGGALKPELTVGAFQGSELQPDLMLKSSDALEARDGQNIAVRATFRPQHFEFGAYVERRSTIAFGGGLDSRGEYVGPIIHAWLAGADLKIDKVFSSHAIRAWVEGMTGSSWYDQKRDGTADATFVLGRTIVAWRWGGVAAGDRYLEPFVSAGALNPDTSVVNDVIWEGTAGVNIGTWRQARLTVEFEMSKSGSAIPSQLFYGDITVTNRKALVIEAGAAF